MSLENLPEEFDRKALKTFEQFLEMASKPETYEIFYPHFTYNNEHDNPKGIPLYIDDLETEINKAIEEIRLNGIDYYYFCYDTQIELEGRLREVILFEFAEENYENSYLFAQEYEYVEEPAHSKLIGEIIFIGTSENIMNKRK